MWRDFKEISDQMQVYFDGLYLSDRDKLAAVFHPDARYICATDKDLTNLSMAEYFPIVTARTSPASRGDIRKDAIVSIELAGANSAFVRAHCAVGDRYFTDLLTLIKADGVWRIMSKVFHYDLAPPPPGGRSSR